VLFSQFGSVKGGFRSENIGIYHSLTEAISSNHQIIMDPVLPVAFTPYDEAVEVTGDVSNMTVDQYMSWVR
jgi:hypothetical protein